MADLHHYPPEDLTNSYSDQIPHSKNIGKMHEMVRCHGTKELDTQKGGE